MNNENRKQWQRLARAIITVNIKVQEKNDATTGGSSYQVKNSGKSVFAMTEG